MKRQRNTTKIKEQTRNTEVQINEEEIGKLPEKHNQNVENRMENMQEPINKDLEELKNKQRETTQLMKLKILYKESVADYLENE